MFIILLIINFFLPLFLFAKKDKKNFTYLIYLHYKYIITNINFNQEKDLQTHLLFYDRVAIYTLVNGGF